MAELDIGSYFRPMRRNLHCGDFVLLARTESVNVVGIVDIAGHGYHAFNAGRPVVAKLKQLISESVTDPVHILEAAHELLKGSPGAAVGVLAIEGDSAVFAGVGNIRCLHVMIDNDHNAKCLYIASRDGLVGVRLHTPYVHKIALSPGHLIILHSDGVGSSLGDWNVRQMYTGSSLSVAKAIVDRYGRDSDDASCAVVRR